MKKNNWFKNLLLYIWYGKAKQEIKEEKIVIDAEILKSINIMLDVAKKLKLDTEIIASSLKTIKENPKLSIVEAFEIGYSEWIK